MAVAIVELMFEGGQQLGSLTPETGPQSVSDAILEATTELASPQATTEFNW